MSRPQCGLLFVFNDVAEGHLPYAACFFVDLWYNYGNVTLKGVPG